MISKKGKKKEMQRKLFYLSDKPNCKLQRNGK